LQILINAVTLALIAEIFPGLSYGQDIKILFVGGLFLTMINVFFRPIIKLLLLPINLVTLGMFRWLSNVICVFILTVFIPEIQIKSFQMAGFSASGFVVPGFYFSLLLSLITASFLLSLFSGFILWLIKN